MNHQSGAACEANKNQNNDCCNGCRFNCHPVRCRIGLYADPLRESQLYPGMPYHTTIPRGR